MRTLLPKIADYPAYLEACWQEHLKPRELDAPTVISLFAGCGGSSLGYSMAGYRELLAVEWDGHAVETFKLNFPDVPVWHGDIADLSVDECLKIAGLKPGELDVLDGSPPCQGFSTAGRRRMDDGRNELFREYVRLLRGLQPKVLVMENVSGMVKGKMRLIFAEIMRELKASGYRVSARLMNAMYFGVPQSRERMIFIGIREDLASGPDHPNPQFRPPTAREAIGHLPLGKQGNNHPRTIGAWHRSRPGQSLRKAVRHVGSFHSVRLDPDKPSTTQIKGHLNWHYAVPRKLTIPEAATLGGFPCRFSFPNTIAGRKEQIGNSVPPPFMRAIAQYIRETILAAVSDAERAA